ACRASPDTRCAGRRARCEAAQAASMARSPRRVRRAREKSAGRTSGSCLRRRDVRRTGSGWCSSRAARAGSCPRLRRCRDADTKKRVRPGKGGAQTGSRENRCWQGRNRRRVRPTHLPPRLFGDFVPDAHSSGQAFQEALNQNSKLLAHGEADLAAENVIFAERNLVEQTLINGDEHPKCWLTVLFDERNEFLSSAVILAGALGLHRQK